MKENSLINKVVKRTHGGIEYIWYWCHGCKHNHGVPINRWKWNNSLDKPTITPSVRHFIPAFENQLEKTLCHYHIENGFIKFCNDCDHSFKGQTVEMICPEGVPENS